MKFEVEVSENGGNEGVKISACRVDLCSGKSTPPSKVTNRGKCFNEAGGLYVFCQGVNKVTRQISGMSQVIDVSIKEKRTKTIPAINTKPMMKEIQKNAIFSGKLYF